MRGVWIGMRGFERVKEFSNEDFSLPQRKTPGSAGYDFYLPCDAVLEAGKVTMIPTGVKAYMRNDEYLGIHLRSSIARKHCLLLVNGQGIVDSDYYDNEDNEGHIMLLIYNPNRLDVSLKKGERIAQGIFYAYLLADGDGAAAKETRKGGFGSTQ